MTFPMDTDAKFVVSVSFVTGYHSWKQEENDERRRGKRKDTDHRKAQRKTKRVKKRMMEELREGGRTDHREA